ncbi:hypothetical protein TNCV_2376211 [Trichonephila clavipes]|nr:hypothetical protein TNCV_2376211 [Trichonephila clavipes]
MIVQFRNEKVSNHGSIPITIDCNVVAFIVFEEGFHQPIKRTKHDEAHFWLNGYVNKRNCRIWSEYNPQVYVETPLHPEKLTVWCALWAGGIIGSYFFKNDEGHNVTVNGDRYRAMITNFFIPELNNHDVQELWFQQDGATYHTARATIDLLKTRLSLVYADKPQTLDHLEDNIRRVIADIRPQMLEKVIENGTSRLDYIRASRGSPMPEIIFKIRSVQTTLPPRSPWGLWDWGPLFRVMDSRSRGSRVQVLFFQKLVIDRLPINFALRSSMKIIGYIPRNFEPQPSNEVDTSSDTTLFKFRRQHKGFERR